MGLFLQTAIITDCNTETAKSVLSKFDKKSIKEMDLDLDACRFQEKNGSVNILFNEYCSGYDGLAQKLSENVDGLVMVLYIYDEDFWGYYLYQNGKHLDTFNPMPDYFEEVDDEERRKFAGNAALVADLFGVAESDISRYLVEWTEDIMEECNEKAYPDDEFEQCDCWQMADFMNKLGYPYEW